MSKEVAQGILRELARSFERDYECTCKPLCAPYTPPLTATGHKQGCPVDDAVRLDLAKAGII
jgi:hypothetical protein